MAAKAEEVDIDSDEEEELRPKVAAAAEPEVQEDTSLNNEAVVTKYQEAARIVNSVMTDIQTISVAGTPILSICVAAETMVAERTAAMYKSKGKGGKVIERGSAFPVCISVNEVVCHYTPLASEDKLPPLADGDMVKIDMAVHIDGYIAVGAHTFIVGHVANAEAPVTGPRADVLHAAWAAARVAAALIVPGNTNTQVTAAVKQIADAYNVKPISGTVMHEMKRYVIDGKKNILLRSDNDERVEACTFEQGEIYSIDVAMSTGTGNPRPAEYRTTVFKRHVERKFGLKIKASRTFFNEINKRFPALPFTTRFIADESSAKMGVRECVTHELLASYPVLLERAGDQVAHVKFTVLLTASGTAKITGLEMPAGVVSDKTLPAEIAAILAAAESRANKKSKKKASKKKKEAAAGAAATATEAN